MSGPGERHGGASRARRVGAAVVTSVGLAVVAGCGGDESAVPTLTWYTTNVPQADLAAKCSEQAEDYDIRTSLLPNNASGQREQLLRRLAASDRSVDVISLDPPFMAEFANAGFLRPYTPQEREELSEGVLDGPLEGSVFDDQLYMSPLNSNTQLLWYKRDVAEQAGILEALESGTATWDQLIEAAEQTETNIGAQGRANESLMVWVNALVESAGGTILDPESEGLPAAEVDVALDSPAGAEAARIMNTLAESPAAPPALGTAGEEESRAAFQSEQGGFMVNWPYVWAAFAAGQDNGSLSPDFQENVGWAPYPRVDPGTPSAKPIGGIGLAVGAFTEYPDLAVDAVRCLTSVESQTELMLSQGDPAAKAEVYDNPEVREFLPMWELIRDGLQEAVPRPITPYYGDVTGGIQQGYHPPNEINPETTPERTARLIEGVLANEQLL